MTSDSGQFDTEDFVDLPDGVFARFLLTFFQLAGLVWSIPSAGSTGQVESVRQGSLKDLRPTLMTPQDAIQAWRRDMVDESTVRETLARYGLPDDAQTVMMQLSRALIAPGEVVALWLRGEIDTDERDARLAALGYEADAADLLVRLAEYVPPPQDVIRLAVREAFNDEAAARFGLDEDNPLDTGTARGEVARLLQASGMTPDTFRAYWRAHWELISPTAAFEARHRSPESGFTASDLDLLLQTADVSPQLRQVLTSITYTPYTRVDIRRMYSLGILSADPDERPQPSDVDATGAPLGPMVDEVTRAYMDIGYDLERAQKLRDFTVLTEGSDEVDPRAEIRSRMRTRVQSLYERDIIAEDDARALLEKLGTDADVIDAYLAEAEFTREFQLQDDTRNQIRSLYVSGFWSEGESAAALQEIGYDADQVGRLFADWRIRRQYREATDAEKAERDLTKAEVVGAYGDLILDRETAADLLMGLGYDPEEAAVLLDREDMKAAQEQQRRAERTVELRYKAGHFTRSEALTKLDGAGVIASRRESIVEQWDAEIAAQAKTLTPSQIAKAVKLGIMLTADAVERLVREGYTQDDAAILLQVLGVESPGGEGVE